MTTDTVGLFLSCKKWKKHTKTEKRSNQNQSKSSIIFVGVGGMTLGSGGLLVINGHCCFSVSSELPTVPFPFVFQQNKKKTKRNATDT